MIDHNTFSPTQDSGRDDGLETTSDVDVQSLVYQELPARLTNPLKLVALLRMQFGVGKYDVSVSNERLLPRVLLQRPPEMASNSEKYMYGI